MESHLPASLALLAAALWGFNAHIQRKALDDTDALTGAFLSVATTAALGWFAAPFFVESAWWTSRAALIFAAMGIFFPALGQRLQIASVGLVGPTLTAVLAAFTPVVAVALGVAIFGEKVNFQAGLGLALMITGLVLSTWSPRGLKRGWPLWAIAVPLGAALVRGIAQPGLKLGLAALPSPLFALLVTSSMSTLVLGAMLWRHHARGRTRFGRGVRLFVVNGAINGTGILALNFALGMGALTLVSPLAATVPLWAYAFGLVVFRRESLGFRLLFVAMLVVAGGVLVLTR